MSLETCRLIDIAWPIVLLLFVHVFFNDEPITPGIRLAQRIFPKVEIILAANIAKESRP